MGFKFRIIDRFKVTGRGLVYMLKPDKGAFIRVGESLYDFQGNKFKVSGIEMITRCWKHATSIDEIPVGVAVELVNGVEVQGAFLFKELADVDMREL